MTRLLTSLALVLSLAACMPNDGAAPAETGPRLAQPGAEGQCTGAPVFEAPALNTCAGGHTRLAFVGDVLLHRQIAELGYRIGFGPIWPQPARYLREADIAIANLEGPAAPGLARGGRQMADPGPVFDGVVHTGYPQFNYHPSVLRDLKAAGVDIVTTANNHAMDRGPLGVELTLAETRKAGLVPLGTVARGQTHDFVHRRGSPAGTLSFIACTFGTNDIADPGAQVLNCYRDRAQLLALVRREAGDPGVAGVIVLPHWGVEYSTAPSARQRGLARDLVNAGATAVIGTHPHAVQPFETRQAPGGQTVPVVYSTGNFIAGQPTTPSIYEAMALVDLCQGPNGRAVAQQAGWIAMQMSFSSRGYWVDVPPRGSGSAAEAFLTRVAPGFSAQPPACGG